MALEHPPRYQNSAEDIQDDIQVLNFKKEVSPDCPECTVG